MELASAVKEISIVRGQRSLNDVETLDGSQVFDLPVDEYVRLLAFMPWELDFLRHSREWPKT